LIFIKTIKNNYVKNIFLISVIIYAVVFLTSCDNQEHQTDDFINKNRLVTSIAEMDFDITLRELPSSDIGQGIALGAFPGLENTLDETCPDGCWGSFILETPQDILTVNVMNYNSVKVNFMLKLFYNYEEVSFKILGSDDFKTEFLFALDAGIDADIHLQLEDNLEINEYLNKLTVSLFSMPEYYAGLASWERVDDMSNMVINFELSYGFDTPNLLQLESSTLQVQTLLTDVGWFGVNIIDSVNLNDPDDIIFPSNLIHGNPGEVLELGFLTDLSDSTEELLESYLLLALLDWQQIDINDSAYLFVLIDDNPESFVNYGRFFVTLPEEPGRYELILVGIPNPTALNTQANYFPLETSQRITIQVE